MFGLTRAVLTLIGVASAVVLVWLAAQIGDDSTADYWALYAVLACAGLGMALSQLLGGWTKWGWPRISGKVFLLGFVPAFILGGWILADQEPGDGWLGRNVRSWSDNLGIEGFVSDMGLMTPAIAFAIGLVFGLTFDTTGPRSARTRGVPAAGARRSVTATDGNGTVEDRRVRLDDDEPTAPVTPKTGEPVKK
jgi:hypothetical protein